jgi:hypothetical protein
MKSTLRAEYFALYLPGPVEPSREQMLSAVRYYRRMRGGPLWAAPRGHGNRAIRRFAAILDASRGVAARHYNWFSGLSWHGGNRLGLCCSNAEACHLL